MPCRPALLLLTLCLVAACSRPVYPDAGDAIMSQPGPNGTAWALTEVSADDDVLMVQFRVRSATGERASTWLPIEQISLLDDASATRYRLLMGKDGRHLASEADIDLLKIEVGEDSPVWMKFPAPPASSPTVSIALPKVGAFDGIRVDR